MALPLTVINMRLIRSLQQRVSFCESIANAPALPASKPQVLVAKQSRQKAATAQTLLREVL